MKLENYKMVSVTPISKGSKAVVCTYVHKDTNEEISIGRMMKKIVIKSDRVNITIEYTESDELESKDPVKVDVLESEEEVKVYVRDRSFEFNYVVSRYRERAEKIREEEAKRSAWTKASEKFVNNASKLVEEVIDRLSR